MKFNKGMVALSAAIASLAIAGGAYASNHQASPSSASASTDQVLQPGDSGYFAPGFTAAGNPAGTVGR